MKSSSAPKPIEGQIIGSQPPAEPFASLPSGGLAVQAPGAEQSAPAADETEAVRFVLAMARAAIEQRDRKIARLEAEAAYQHGVVKQLSDALRKIHTPMSLARTL